MAATFQQQTSATKLAQLILLLKVLHLNANRCSGRSVVNSEEDECDSDNEVDMPPILPRVVNADEIGRIITQDYLEDGLPEEFIK